MTDPEATEACSPGRRLVRYAAVPQPAWNQHFVQPVLDAEARRGNPGEWSFGDYQIAEAGIVFGGRIDTKALTAEFELDEGMSIRTQRGAGIIYRDADGEIALTLDGADRPRSEAMEAVRAAWWREWRAKPRARVTLHNPFLHPEALPDVIAPRPVMLAEVPDDIELERHMSSELPGLGDGWSVWPFTSAKGNGLLVIAPEWFDEVSAHAAIDSAGGATHPVLLAIRGRESSPIEAALRSAKAEAKYLL
ncbi:MAG: hypothetical protein ABJA11_00780 [Pseudolysinimonas sp.]